jgi:hypothetical protein
MNDTTHTDQIHTNHTNHEVTLQSLQQTLQDGAAQLDDTITALKEVVTLFETGGLTGPHGNRWRDQVHDRLLPFVDETQAALRDLAQHIEHVEQNH